MLRQSSLFNINISPGRLQEELQILRRVYEQHMEKNKEYLEMRYQKKVTVRNKDNDNLGWI